MRRLVTFVVVCSIASVSSAFAQGPPAGGPGAGSTTAITKVVPNFTIPEVTIDGQDFGTTPTVTLGDDLGGFVTLVNTTVTDTRIVAMLPGSLDPGTYMLVVEAGNGATATGIMDVTLGTSEVACVGCIDASEVSFPYAGSSTAGGKAFDSDHADDADTLGEDPPSAFASSGHSHGGSSPWTVNGSDLFYTGGDVGVGTANPDAEIDTGGMIRALSTPVNVPTSGRGLELFYAGSGVQRAIVSSRDRSTGAFHRLDLNGNEILLFANSPSAVEVMRIAEPASTPAGFAHGGRVGIGTGSPDGILHIDGPDSPVSDVFQLVIDHTGDNARVDLRANNNKQAEIGLQDDSDAGLYIRTQNLQRFAVNQNGNVLIGQGNGLASEKLHVLGNILATGTITAGSSREFKDNITPLSKDEAFSAFRALEPVKFTYKADQTGDLQLGFIAEDVPELVAIPSRKGIAPMDLVALLTKVVQQQEERIEALEERVEALEK